MGICNDHAIVLSGGGARGAYQAGALRAVFEICKSQGDYSLFRNLVGVSAGAINATYLATEAGNLDKATENLCQMWRTLTSEDVFKTDYFTVGKQAVKMFRSVSLGGVSGRLRPTRSGLMNVEPLRDILQEYIHFDRIESNIRSGALHSLAVTALDYSTALGVTFFMGDPKLKEWRRVQRIGVRSQIGVDHVMASAAIPIFFPPWKIGDRYYGDGTLRNTAPLAPARRVGAQKILVIGVRKVREQRLTEDNIINPTLGRVLSVVINAIFMDAIEIDIERVRIINENMSLTSAGKFRPLSILHISPSQMLSELAETRMEGLPPLLRFLLSGLGSPKETSEILSYLAFDPVYLSSLVDLGYRDVLAQKENLLLFMQDQG
ncbi:MAG: patatin-like phospholipase family protein [Bdellovibrionales bacterium]